MTQFFVRKTQAVRLPDGRPHALVRGLREVPDQLANSADSHKLGVVAVNEMTDQERAEFGLPLVPDFKPEPPEETQVPAPGTSTPGNLKTAEGGQAGQTSSPAATVKKAD